MSVESAAARAEPACPNCGYSRKGLASEGAACPECGAAPPSGSDAWLRTMRSSMTILCWAIPAMLLAWASPAIFRVGSGDGTTSFVSGSSWLMLLSAGAIAFALMQINRCLPTSSLTHWYPRVAVLALVCLACSVADSNVVSSLTVPFSRESYLVASSIFGVLWICCLAAAAVPAASVLARGAHAAGLPRAASRLSRLSWITAVIVSISELWLAEGHRFQPQSLPRSAFGTPPKLEPILTPWELFSMAISIAQFSSALLVIALTLLAWHAAALARRQFLSHPPSAAIP